MANGTTNGYVATTPGGQWSCAGLTYDAGTTYLNYDFGNQTVNTAYPAPLLVNGDVAINGTLNCAIANGIWLGTGTYPLLSYSGTLTPAPTINLTALPAGIAATLSNDTANKRIVLVVTAAPPPVFPGSTNGVWTSLAYNNSDPTNGFWSLANNWTNGLVASGPSATANFTTLSIATNSLVTNDAPRSVGNLLFARPTPVNNVSWTFTGGAANKLNLASLTTDQPVITVSNVTALVGGLTGSQGFVKDGNGVLAIFGNTYGNLVTGPIRVKAGLLASVNGTAFGNLSGASGSITVDAGASLGVNSRFDGVPVQAPIYLNGTGGTPSGYYNNAPTLDIVAGADVFGGSTAPFGALDVYGNGVVGGPIYLLTDSKISHSWDNGFINGPIIGTNGLGKNLEIRTYQSTQGDLQIGGSISLGTGALTINGTGNQGVRLNNANNYSGGTYLTAGKLRVGNLNAVSSGTLTMTGGFVDMYSDLVVSQLSGATSTSIGSSQTTPGTYTITVTQSVATTYSGRITNNAARLVALTKLGTGELAMAGINSYSGATAVSAGRFMGVTGGSCSNTVIQIADGATNGVKLATAEGQWACAGLTYDFAGSQSVVFDFNGFTPSTTTAPLNVNGAVAFDGTVTVLIPTGWGGIGTYPLITAAGGIAGTTPAVVLPPSMGGYLQVIGNILYLNVTSNSVAPTPTILPVYGDGLGNVVLRTATSAGYNYLLLSTTNLTAPVTWVTNSTTAGSGGTITNTVPVTLTQPNQFFRYQAQ
jgi:autotransporter-associated beta strand protein